jgi:predicted GIY-YIG superfamily endonuclease
MPKPCVYIIELKCGKYYVGSTTNFDQRYKQHQRRDHAGTSFSKPINVLLVQHFETYSMARKVEAKIKSKKSRVLIEKIIQNKSIDIKLLGV